MDMFGSRIFVFNDMLIVVHDYFFENPYCNCEHNVSVYYCGKKNRIRENTCRRGVPSHKYAIF